MAEQILLVPLDDGELCEHVYLNPVQHQDIFYYEEEVTYGSDGVEITGWKEHPGAIKVVLCDACAASIRQSWANIIFPEGKQKFRKGPPPGTPLGGPPPVPPGVDPRKAEPWKSWKK